MVFVHFFVWIDFLVYGTSKTSAEALLRYREELKMHAALRDEKLAPDHFPASMDDRQFLDERAKNIRESWLQGSMLHCYHYSLSEAF